MKTLSFELTEDCYNELTLKIFDKNKKRFQLPYYEPFAYTKQCE